MEGASQREAIVIDATPTPDPEPGGARLLDPIQSAAATNGEGGSQQPSQPAGYVSPKTLLLFQLRSCYMMAKVC